MPTYQFRSLDELFTFQDSVPERVLEASEWDTDNLTATVPDEFAFESNQAAAIISNGEAPEPLELGDLDRRLDLIEADQQYIEIPYSQLTQRRSWTPVAGAYGIPITADLAGTWVFSATAIDQSDGRAIGIRILINGEVDIQQAIDGSGRTGDSAVSVSSSVVVADGDVVGIEVIQDISNNIYLDGKFRGVKIF